MQSKLTALSFLLLAACGGDSQTTAPGAADGASTAGGAAPAEGSASDASIEPVKVDLYVMSMCPYGIEAENALVPIKEKLGTALYVNIEYLGRTKDGELQSKHGPQEVAGDLAQVCAAKQAPDDILDLIACQNETPTDVGRNWKRCGGEVGLDVVALEACVNGEEGKTLLAESFARSSALGVRSSPTFFLDDEPYMGGYSDLGLMRAICAKYAGAKPSACADVPAAVAVKAIFLSDSRCPKCDIHGVEPKLRGQLPGLEVTYMDYSTPEGKALYAELQAAQPGFRMLPAILLDPAVEKDVDGYPQLERFLRPLGPYHELMLGGSFDPTAEICDNGVDDDANGAIDCKDAGCAGVMVCREPIAKKLDLFVMSQCPYGAAALVTVNDVARHFGRDMDVDVHFIGGMEDGRLSSMHGQMEVDLDIYEVCAQKLSPSKYLSFDACISRDYRKPDWKACAREAGIGEAALEGCFEGEGKDLLEKSFDVSAKLGIGSSPTYLLNNQRIVQGVDAAGLQREFCADNPGLAGCAEPLTASSMAAPAPGNCGD